MPKHTNVLIFCVDEMRADHLGCAGNPVVRTPQIDRIASRGTRFERAYCNNPICMPARASMFTGLLPRDHGLRVNGQTLRRDLPTLPGILSAAGYRTYSAGKLHLSPYVPMADPPEPDAYPECLDYWKQGLLRTFPAPYYGFQSVDFVGGHTAFVFGAYIQWLKEQGGDPALLLPEKALPARVPTPDCYRMALPKELHYNRYISDGVIRFLADAGRERPFFVWCSFPDPHAPIAPPRPYDEMYAPADIPLPPRRSEESRQWPELYRKIISGEVLPNGHEHYRWSSLTDDQLREVIALTYGMITHVDDEIGRVLARLEAEGLANNTMVIFISDHGDMLGDHNLFWKGPYTFQECTRIPFIVAPPAAAGGRVSQALVSQIDLLPSVLDGCGLPLPGSDWVRRETPFRWQQVRPLRLYPGKSWMPLLKETEAPDLHQEILIENDNPATGYQIRTLVTQRHRLTFLPGTPDGELYDLLADPHEWNNLWNDAAHASLKADLIARMMSAYSEATPAFPVPPWNS